MTGPALVCHHRLPEFDRERGSRRVLEVIESLQAQGRQVTFLALDGAQGTRYERHLQQSGVRTFIGLDERARDAIAGSGFELAVMEFWHTSAVVTPIVRELSPSTRVALDSIDLHFLRAARRRSLGADDGSAPFDDQFAAETTAELNAYAAVDLVLTVSQKEADLLEDLTGGSVPTAVVGLCEAIARSPHPLEDRRGIVFLGNFRHLPNVEAAVWLLDDVVPRLDPRLLDRHPLSIVGHAMDERPASLARAVPPGVRMVGWVPEVEPYLHRTRVSVAPLLHGAGVKGKVIQSMMAGTPVVTTTVGVEGIEVVAGEHLLVVDGAAALARSVTELLVDDERWERLAEAGHAAVAAAHDPATTRAQLADAVQVLLGRATRSTATGVLDLENHAMGAEQRWAHDYASLRVRVPARLAQVTPPGATVLVISGGDDALVDIPGRHGRHLPSTDDGHHAGTLPADAAEAVAWLEAAGAEGVELLAIPVCSRWWLHHHRGLLDHLDLNSEVVYEDDDVTVFRLTSPATRSILVVGPGDAAAGHPHVARAASLDLVADADLVAYEHVLVTDGSSPLTAAQLDVLVDVQRSSGWAVVQPAVEVGGLPSAAAPILGRQPGIAGRELDRVGRHPLALYAGAHAWRARGGSRPDADAIRVGIADAVGVTVEPAAVARHDETGRQVLGVLAGERGPLQDARAPRPSTLSVVIATRDRPDLLRQCLLSLVDQTAPVEQWEVVVVDDGTAGGDALEVCRDLQALLPLRSVRIPPCGRSVAKNLGVLLAVGSLVLLLDDDDEADPGLLAAHLQAHSELQDAATAVLGRTEWSERVGITPLMHCVTEVHPRLFSYGSLADGQVLGWQHFWEGRLSCKRDLLLDQGLHDPRLEYTVDIELGWRLRTAGLQVVYRPEARSTMARSVTYDDLAARSEAKGRAQATFAMLHPDPEVVGYCLTADAATRWADMGRHLPFWEARIRQIELALPDLATADQHPALRDELYDTYHAALATRTDAGIVAALAEDDPRSSGPSGAGSSAADEPGGRPARSGVDADGDVEPVLSVIVPIWNTTPELAAMTQRNVERLRRVQSVPTELVIVDNGSPCHAELAADALHRFDENRGIASAWNTGAGLATAPVLVFLNNDVEVEPGWDLHLVDAARANPCIAFPYTDHRDGLGLRRPDQAGTAGWCFAMTRAVLQQVGPFDQRFDPAFCEDTDFFHRAWEAGVALTPVGAAAVAHARRTTAQHDDRHELLLQAHRLKYGWKHGVDPHAPPPFYLRVVEDHRPDIPLPKILGIGLNKTGTTSLAAALGQLGLDCLDWGGEAAYKNVLRAKAEGRRLLEHVGEQHDAYVDIGSLIESFDHADRQYPGTRFIYTVRDLDGWLDSRRRHIERNRRNRDRGLYPGSNLHIDLDAWAEEWRAHDAKVRAHFEDRPDDLLVLDVRAADAWARLASFLGRPVPEGAFPHERRDLGADPIADALWGSAAARGMS